MNLGLSAMLSGLALILSSSVIFAQAPSRINYQAVARDASTGQELSNQQVFVVIRILNGGPSGDPVYEESHSGIQTNEFGLLNLQIGGGDVTEGSFASIPWQSGNIWFELEIDSGGGLESMGAMQFVSVPYSLYAENTGNTDDADADPQNELITAATFDPETQTISISEADGSTTEVSLENLSVDDGDSDPTNELIDPESGLQLLGTNLQITENDITYTVNLDALIDDADADPENELIDDNGLFLTDDTLLTIIEGGVSHQLNLGDLQDDDDWELSNNNLFTQDRNVGIGTALPQGRLDIQETDPETVKLRVGSEEDVILYGKGDRIGLHTEAPLSSTHFSKSIGYDYTLVTNESNSGYTATENDYMIVVRLIPAGSSEFTVSLPPADQCEGRVYLIRKTGNALGPAEVLIDTGEFPVDFLSPDLELDEPNAETAVLLSLGADGWTRILRDN
jgi:hypothetical protein